MSLGLRDRVPFDHTVVKFFSLFLNEKMRDVPFKTRFLLSTGKFITRSVGIGAKGKKFHESRNVYEQCVVVYIGRKWGRGTVPIRHKK